MGMLVFLALLAGISSCFVKEDLRRTNATNLLHMALASSTEVKIGNARLGWCQKGRMSDQIYQTTDCYAIFLSIERLCRRQNS